MRYRTFLKIPNFPISMLGFGCMHLPTLDRDPNRIDMESAVRLLRQAIDAGVNCLDTAYPYHGGHSEVCMAQALKDGYRAKVWLATKLPVWMVHAEADWERLLDKQCKRLEVDHIDFYLLHALGHVTSKLPPRRCCASIEGAGLLPPFGIEAHLAGACDQILEFARALHIDREGFGAGHVQHDGRTLARRTVVLCPVLRQYDQACADEDRFFQIVRDEEEACS